MDVMIISVLFTSIMNLLVTLRQSRCTEIESSCCGFDLHIERDVVDVENPQ